MIFQLIVWKENVIIMLMKEKRIKDCPNSSNKESGERQLLNLVDENVVEYAVVLFVIIWKMLPLGELKE